MVTSGHVRQKRRSKLKMLVTVAMLVSSASAQSDQYDTSCNNGEYLSVNGDSTAYEGFVCMPCQPGYYCDGGSGHTNQFMKRCQNGYYSDYGAASCTICPAGKFCPDPTAVPQYVDAGQYTTDGATAAKVCPDGTYCKEDGTYATCPVGYTCNDDNYAYAWPIKCPAGKVCTGPLASQIQDCPSGSYSLQGSTQCTICPPGNYCPSKDHPEIPCPNGYYESKGGSQSCNKCPKGYECPTADKAKPPQRCQKGFYAPIEGLTACLQCPAGTQCADPTTFPTPCEMGKYAPAGEGTCMWCPAGFECPDLESASECSSGYYSFGGSDCIKCPAGSECPRKDWKPQECLPGYYSTAGETSCTICDAGKFCADPAGVPALCPHGTTSEAGSTVCKGCPDGSICDSAAGSVTPCTGGQIPNQDGSACMDCPAGYACPNNAFGSMEPCTPGFYSKAGEYSCTICPIGNSCMTTYDDPVPCNPGYYADLGQTTCLQCPPGFDCSNDESGRHIFLCPPGSTYDGTDGTCQECPAGKFCPLAIGGYRADGIDCVDGTYSKAGQTECTLCPAGHSCADKITPVACNPGEYQIGGNKDCSTCPKDHECPFMKNIAPCPIFHYSNEGEGNCLPCEDGKDCRDIHNTTDPVSCTAGFYSRAIDFMCVSCPRGHYCPLATPEPIICDGGSYADEEQATCTPCPSEYYSKPGSAYCTPVPPGFKINSAGDDIEPCAHKTYSYWGQTDCQPCADGYLCPEKTGDMTPWHFSCPRGSYCAAGVETKCPAGKAGIRERATTLLDGCTDCPPGYYCPEGTADYTKNPCPRGAYCEAGQPIAVCPQGTYNDNLFGRSVSDCRPCPNGHECAEMTVDKGEVCQQGYYCPIGSYPQQFPCPAGSHGASRTGKSDVSECLPCPPGHYCEEGSPSPTKTPAGYWTPNTNVPSLAAAYKCPPKFHCPNEGMTNYKGFECPAGHFCPAGTSDYTTTPCPEGTFSDRRDLHDASHCSPCPKGFYCAAGSTNSDVTECPQNSYCPTGTKAASIPVCPAGSYSPYLRSMSLEDCLICPPGKYCLAGMNPATCDAGYYCPEGTQTATQFPCSPGYYSELTGQHSIMTCKHCGVNNECPDYAMQAPTQCVDGYYNDATTTATRCEICPAGYFCVQDVSNPSLTPHPEPCMPGFYSDQGATTCEYCGVGYFCPLQATTKEQMEKNLCPQGTYCLRVVQIQNLGTGVLEDHNKGLDVYPNNEDHACPKFKYCPKGTGKTGLLNDIPLDIPKGTMQEVFARGDLSDAINLPAGWYTKALLTDGSDARYPAQIYEVLPCPEGYYCPDGSYIETACPAGTFRNDLYGKDVTDCGACPAGTYCPSVGMSTPTICGKGKFCPEGSIVEQNCPLGTYNDVEGLYDSRGCKECTAGRYCPFLGQIAVNDADHQCDAGFLCLGGASRPEPTDLTTGQLCPLGGYCEQGTSAMQPCDPGKIGKYQGASSDTECIVCDPGQFCIGDGTSKDCPAGFWCSGQTVDYKIAAADPNAGQPGPGQYTPTGSRTSLDCPEGTYSKITGATECTKCEAGVYCDALGLDEASRPDCEAGFYCPSKESFDIAGETYTTIPCPRGTYIDLQNRVKLDDCLPCPATYACEEEGLAVAPSSNDQKCAKGFWCKSSAETRWPVTERAGYYGPCPAGHYCEEGTEDPTPCPEGKFNPQIGAWDASFCLDCPPGWLCTSLNGAGGVTEPTQPCSAGTKCNDGLVEEQCAAKFYCPIESHEELFCPTGYYNTVQGRGYCTDCPAGKFCIAGEATDCDPGHYCPGI